MASGSPVTAAAAPPDTTSAKTVEPAISAERLPRAADSAIDDDPGVACGHHESRCVVDPGIDLSDPGGQRSDSRIAHVHLVERTGGQGMDGCRILLDRGSVQLVSAHQTVTSSAA